MDEIKGDKDAGVRLKSLRFEMRASQRAFGEPLGFNQAALSAFEQGKVVVRKSDAFAVEYVSPTNGCCSGSGRECASWRS